MDNWIICQLENNYIFSNVVNYYAAHLRQLIAASLLKGLYKVQQLSGNHDIIMS